MIGGGAGGLSAATTARRAEASVTVRDERMVGGGQYYKQAAVGRPLDAQQAEEEKLLAQAHASGATSIEGVGLWGAFDGPLFLAKQASAALVAKPKTVIVATGA